MKQPSHVYIMSCKSRKVLYVGVTSKLEQRVKQHKNHTMPNSFTARYNCVDLVYFEEFPNIEEAILREKEIKGWSRKKKEDLIKTLNPGMIDLALTLE